jgi:hypothetical protein
MPEASMHLASMHLASMHLASMHLASMHLASMHLASMHLMRSAPEGLYLYNCDIDHAAIGRNVGDGVTGLLAKNGGSQR